jgi:hypothetical protein
MCMFMALQKFPIKSINKRREENARVFVQLSQTHIAVPLAFALVAHFVNFSCEDFLE